MTTYSRPFLAFGFLAVFWSEATVAAPVDLPADDRIKLLAYDETDIYKIITRYGYQTNIVFAPNEDIVTISVGDRSVWQLIPSGHRLFIRPMKAGATTNMTLLTNRRSYYFDLKSVGEEEDDSKNIYVAKFIYPGDALWEKYFPPKPAAEAESTSHAPVQAPVVETVKAPESSVAEPTPPVTVPAAVEPVVEKPQASTATAPAALQPIYPNYNYTYSGPDTAAPLQVYDNGKSTFIRYLTLPSPLPEVYVVDTKGNRVKTQSTVQGTMLVLSTVAGTLALVSGETTLTVYNEMLNPEKTL